MNKKEKIKRIKREIQDLETHEQIFLQSLSATTNRKKYLKMELEELGTSSSPKREKIDFKTKKTLIASLTK